MSGLYIASLITTLICLGAIDRHHSLVFFKDAHRAIRVFGVSLGVFIVWDVLGIVLDIFFIGQTKVLTGIQLGPEFPIEELFFLSVLIYSALIIHRFLAVERHI